MFFFSTTVTLIHLSLFFIETRNEWNECSEGKLTASFLKV